MSISAVGANAVSSFPARKEAAEGPGPDKTNDHDSDDVKAAAAAGTGTLLDKFA